MCTSVTKEIKYIDTYLFQKLVSILRACLRFEQHRQM